MQIGQKIKCLAPYDDRYLTAGKEYEIIAAEGDEDKACGGVVIGEDSFIIIDDEGDYVYASLSVSSHAVWEKVD